MSTDTEKTEKCFLCGGETRCLLHGRDFLYKTTDKRFLVLKCLRCGVERISPMPSGSELVSFYPSAYYSYNVSIDNVSQKSLLVRIREKVIETAYSSDVKKDFFYLLAFLARPFFRGLPLKHRGRNFFLDIGCGDGYNVRLMSTYGWNTYGFEIGKKGKTRNIYYDVDFSNVDFGGVTFDYVRIWHVLEHIPNPDQFLQKLQSVLSDDAVIEIGVPNTRSVYAFFFGKFWYNRDIPRHVINYNPSNLRFLLRKHGLKVKKLSYSGVGGFLGSVQHLVNHLFSSKLNFINNLPLVLLFFPIDVFLNFMKSGDCIAVVAEKNEKK